jgi:hypothetical protein
MKTAVIMQRQFNGLPIRQNSKTGFLNVNDLMDCYLTENPKSSKKVENYFRLNQTKEFAETIREAELEAKNQNTHKNGDLVLPLVEPIKVIESKRGVNGGTWVHPYLFLDFAMWLNPKFKLWAMSIIEDKLIELRNESGEKFKEMNQALKSSGATSPREYMKEASLMNKLTFGNPKGGQRNQATQDQLKMLNKLQKYNAHLIGQGMTHSARERECERFIQFYQFIN